MLKFERILTCALRAFPRSWRSFPHAIKNSLGEKVWVRGIISSHLGVPRQKILFTRSSRVACGRRVSHRADTARGDSHRGRRRRMGDADRRPRRAARRRRHGHHAAARDPIPAFARHALFDVHGVSRLRGQRGRVQGDGARRLRPSDDDRAGAEGDPPHCRTARSRWRRSTSSFRPPPSDRIRRNSSICSARRAIRYDPIDLDVGRWAAIRRLRRQRPARARRHRSSISRARLRRETGLPDLVLRRRRRTQRPGERAHPRAKRDSSACSCRRRQATRAARWARRCTPTGSISGNPDRDVPDHPFWGPAGGRARSSRRRRARTARPSRNWMSATLIERVADDLAAGRDRRMDGRRLRVRSAGARPSQHPRGAARDRNARSAESRHQTSRGVPPVRARRAERSGRSLFRSAARRGAARRATCRACFRCGRNGGRRSPRVTHVDGSARVQVLERDMAPRLHALLEAYGRRSGIPVLLNTSFNVAGEPIVTRALEGLHRRSGDAASTCSSREAPSSPSAPSRRPHR